MSRSLGAVMVATLLVPLVARAEASSSSTSRTATRASLAIGAGGGTAYGVATTATRIAVGLTLRERALAVPVDLALDVGTAEGGASLTQGIVSVGALRVLSRVRIGGGFESAVIALGPSRSPRTVWLAAAGVFGLASIDLAALGDDRALTFALRPEILGARALDGSSSTLFPRATASLGLRF